MKAFISSTSKDLGDYRQAAFEVCNRLSIVPIGMEWFESMGAGATAGSKHKLDEADVYVGIVANRYGYIEKGYDKSVTELEFDHAGARGLDRLCFVATPKAQLPTYSEDRDKLAAFSARVQELVRNEFGSPWEFMFKLYDSLLKWLFAQPGTGTLARYVFEPLLAHHARFGGRAEVLDRIKTFIDAPEAGYLVITAPAGYGKTALAVHLVQLNREIAAYHFFSALHDSQARELVSEQFFLRNLVEQMRLWNFLRYDAWQTPSTLSGWVAAYQKFFSMPLAEKRILVIDGLDEVNAWSLRPYLNARPPANLKVILTVRDVGQPWMTEYGLPKARTQHLPLGGLMPEDVRDILKLAGPQTAAFAADASLLDKVVAVTSAPSSVAGADPLYVTCLAEDIESGRVTAANIDKQPPSLEEYLKRWWETVVAQAGTDKAPLEVLGTLAAALGPIQRDDLIALNPSLKSTWMGDPIAKTLGSMRRTVSGTDATGYSFAHPRFRDYVRRYPEVKEYQAKLLDYCKSWKQHRGRYALAYAVQHLAAEGAREDLFSTVLDESFQAAQTERLGSVQPALADLARAVEIAFEDGSLLRILRCVARHRRLAQGAGLTRGVFADLAGGRFADAGRAVAAYGPGAKTSSAWVVALRSYVLWEAVRAGDHAQALALVEQFGRQFGLGYLGASLQTSDLCDALIASALVRDPTLAPDIGVDPEWAPRVVARLNPPGPDSSARAERLAEVGRRIGQLEMTLGENPSMVEFIDEERTAQYTVKLRDALIELAKDPGGREMIDRALRAIGQNPYPRYRDNALVAVGVAVLAVPDLAWVTERLQSILETGLEKEGVTFTFDLPAQLVAEANRRGMPADELTGYLGKAATSHDRWGTRLRSVSARAAAEFAQGRTSQAMQTLEPAGSYDQGFAGYMVTHLLELASRWCEFGKPERVDVLGLIARSRSQAQRVRDPKFAVERQELVDHFERWLAAPPPEWPEASAALRATPDPDTRRAYKDLLSARWSAAGHWSDWKHLILATLNDATALDFVLARLAGRVIREHRAGTRELPDAALAEAMALCWQSLATSRPWELSVPAFG